jgi:L-rhamnonate dehydratase
VNDAPITQVRAIAVVLPSLIAGAEITAPIDRHDRYRRRRSSWYGMMAPVLVEIECADGSTGFGITNGSSAVASVFNGHLSRFLIGERPENLASLWDICYRAIQPYGPDGLAMMALSGIDLALWDLVGKRAGRPVYELLGGKVRDRVPAYASGNDAPWLESIGFSFIKLSMQAGPWDDGDAIAIATNVGIIERGRRGVSESTTLMADAWMGWTVDFATRMAGALAPLGLRWLEEPLAPDDFDRHAGVRRTLGGTSIATGEHLYTPSAFRRLIESGGVDIIQPDAAWCGGITGLRQIAALAAAHGIEVLPHLGGLPWGLHFVISNVGSSMAEWYVGTLPGQEFDSAPSLYTGQAVPIDGWIAPTNAPGFGIEIDREIVEKYGRKH